MERERDSLEASLEQARADLTAAEARAEDEYDRGFKAGKRAQRALGTYREGYGDGYSDAFCCFEGGWPTGAWYVVEIGREGGRPNIESRYDVRQCQRMYLAGAQLYLQGYAC